MAYSANSMDVDTVLVNGEVLLRHKEFTKLDIEKIKLKPNGPRKNSLPKFNLYSLGLGAPS